MKSKRAKAVDIAKNVKEIVWQRDRRGEMIERAKEYIRQFDPEWTEESVTYSKY